MDGLLLFDSARRVTAAHYKLYASLDRITETKSDTLTQPFELQLHDVIEPLKLNLKLGPASEVLVQNGSVWEDYDDYLNPLETAQVDRWNNPTPTIAYIRTIQMLNNKRAAKEEREEQERKVREAEEARRILEEKIAGIKETFPIFDLRFPSEIRQRIWDYALETPNIIRPYRNTSNRGLCAGSWVVPPEYLNVIRVSRRVRDEVAYRLYRNSTFAFSEPQTLECFLEKMSSETLQTIQNLELSFDHVDFFRVFEAWELVQDEHYCRWPEFKSVVPNLRKIDGKLTIRLPNQGLLWGYGWGGACRFVVCKWILKAAKDAMARDPKVILAFQTDRLSEMQRADLDAILSAKETLSYEALSDGTLTRYALSYHALP